MQTTLTQIETGTTRDFIVTYSSQPGTTPYFALYVGSGEGTLVYSATTVASSAIEYHAIYTLPSSRMFYMFEFVSSFSQGPVVTRGAFQAVKTLPPRF